MHLEILACQHVGKRLMQQQDALAIGNTTWQRTRGHHHWPDRDDPPLLASVADGVSASTNPALASRSLLETLHGLPREILGDEAGPEHLKAAVLHALREWNHHFLDEATDGASTTLATVLIGNASVAWINSGDSRIYHVQQKDATTQWQQLSHDHTIWNALLAEGVVTPEQAQEAPAMWTHGLMHCLTLGDDLAEPEWGCGRCVVEPGDCLVLCTDGIHSTLTSEQMQATFDPTESLDCNAKRWWETTLAAGAPDNFSFVFCRFCAS